MFSMFSLKNKIAKSVAQVGGHQTLCAKRGGKGVKNFEQFCSQVKMSMDPYPKNT